MVLGKLADAEWQPGSATECTDTKEGACAM
jgi:hypothetical protein